ncbi:MAG: cellulase family glycosylhydrolase [Anaerolineae bacterium]|nr:cellulase family glycosylhydrolase [Anaerolineae bacterium]
MVEKPDPLARVFNGLIKSKWGTWVINLGLVPILILAGVFLPPISVGKRIVEGGYTPIGETRWSVEDPDGTQLTVLPAGLSGRLSIKLSSVPRLNFLEGSAGKPLLKAAESLPLHLEVKSPLYLISWRGEMPRAATLTIPIPNDAEPYKTLDLYSWTGTEWQWLPSRVLAADDVIVAELSSLPPTVVVVQSKPLAQTLSTAVYPGQTIPAEGRDVLVEINPVGLSLGSDGAIEGRASELPAVGSSATYGVVPVLRNWSEEGGIRSDLVDNLLVSPEAQQSHIQAIVDLVVSNMYQGIEIDYRGINPVLRDQFSAFIAELAKALHAQQKTLAVQVSLPTQVSEDKWDTGVYDWSALGRAADCLMVPALPDPPAYVSGGQMEQFMNWAVSQVDRYKLQLVVSTMGVEHVGINRYTVSYDQALAPFNRIVVEGNPPVIDPGQTISLDLAPHVGFSDIHFDEATQAFWYIYVDDQGREHTVWLETASSLAYKLNMLSAYNVRGVTVENLLGGENDPQMWTALRGFRDRNAISVAGQMAVMWRVQDEMGNLVGQAMASLTDPRYEWTAPQTPGAYTIIAAISSSEGQLVGGESSVAIQVAEFTPTPSPTPTELPTATPTPQPTATPTPQAKAAATATPKPVAAAPAGTGFGYGLDVWMMEQYRGPSINAVKTLGFQWVHQKVRWRNIEGNGKGQYDWGSLDAMVNDCANNGIKICLCVMDAPNWAGNKSPNNPQDFADFMGALAARYKGRVQAYEIWNEQNLSREWGHTPNAAEYMSLLKAAYKAIKAADPNAVVVSGGPTPTGATGPDSIDDRMYLQQMYDNGLKYACDAVGVHPSGFANPPDSKWPEGNDPNRGFDDHPSFFFRNTMEDYHNIIVRNGDNKRLWATEFGWPSCQNMGSPVPGWEYAGEITEQQQADYIVRAYQMAKSWGWAGVMFLWNLDVAPWLGKDHEAAKYCIVYPNWNPRPAFYALANMPK